MNRKWSYVAAMMLTASCGCLFTGCIDNDEPYGIEQIRVATANLLEAKKAVFEAQAASEKAKAEIDKINAEIAKLQAEQAKEAAAAQAEINRLEAEARLAKDQADAAYKQAQADQLKSQTEMDAKERQAQIDRYIAETENYVKTAQLEYDKALYCWEQKKIQYANCQNDKLYAALAGAYNDYLWQLDQYNQANQKYLEAQRKLAELECDLKWVPSGNNGADGSFISPAYNQKALLENAVAEAQHDIEINQNAIAEIEAFQAKLETVKETELASLLEEYQDKLVANTEAYGEALAALEALRVNNPTVFEKPTQIQEQINEAKSKEITIPAYTFKPGAQLAALGILDENIPVVAEGETYTLAEYDADPLDNNLTKAISKYESLIVNLQNYLLDDNDVAWTQARINEMKRQLTVVQEGYTEAEDSWTLAKKVYNNGNTPVASELPNEAEVEAAVAAYNAYEGTYNDAKDKVTAATLDESTKKTAWETENTAYGKKYPNVPGLTAWNTAIATYNNTLTTNDVDWKAAIKAADDALATVNSTQNAAVAEAQKEYEKAVNARVEAQAYLDADPTNKTKEAALQTAKDNESAALKTLGTTETTAKAKKNEAINAHTLAVANANAAKTRKDSDALADLNRAEATWKDASAGAEYNDYASVQAAYDTYQAAIKATTSAQEDFDAIKPDFRKLYEVMIAAVNTQEEKLGTSWYLSTMPNIWIAGFEDQYDKDFVDYIWNNYLDLYTFQPAVVPVDYLTGNQVYLNAKQLLITMSRRAYGSLGTWYDVKNHLFEFVGNDNAFLTDEVTVETLNSYIKADVKRLTGIDIPDYLCYQYYQGGSVIDNDGNYAGYIGGFGWFGQMSWLENRIKVAEDYLANPDAHKAVISELENNVGDLKKTYTDANDALTDLNNQLVAANAAVTALQSDAQAKVNSIQTERSVIFNVIAILQNGIQQLESLAVGTTPELLDNMKKENASNLTMYKAKLAGAEKELADAQYQLDQYNNGYVNLTNPMQPQVDYLKSVVDGAQEYLKFLKARVDELQARYDKATSNGDSTEE